jgi:hypothetical protein
VHQQECRGGDRVCILARSIGENEAEIRRGLPVRTRGYDLERSEIGADEVARAIANTLCKYRMGSHSPNSESVPLSDLQASP